MRIHHAAALLFAISAAAQTTPAPPDVVSSSAGSLRLERLATLEFPWGLALLPDGRVLVTEKPGRLRIWSNGKLSEPVQGVPQVVYRGEDDQGGLLDVEADPAFAQNRYIYLSFVEAAAQQSPDDAETGDARFSTFLDMTDNVLRGGAVARARLDGNQLRDVHVIWRQVPKTIGRGHFGHRVVFAPDGTLFITSGERMRFDPAQSLMSNLGKVVRINRDGSIPADNPFAGKEKARADIYSYGHRNILAATFDTRGRFFVFEMGPLGGDEMNLVLPGKNYGWPEASNGDNYGGQPIADHGVKREYQAPLRSWTPVISPSGALVYSGAHFAGWRGSFLVGGLSSKAIIRITLDGDRIANEERIDMKRRIRDLLQMPDGSLLAIVDDKRGDLLRVTTVTGPRSRD